MRIKLEKYIPQQQLQAMKHLLRGEERGAYTGSMKELDRVIRNMPVTYQTDGIKDKVCHLHYFSGGRDWYIVELDMEGEDNLQAFGYVKTAGAGVSLAYISIKELCSRNDVNLDLYFSPTKASELGLVNLGA